MISLLNILLPCLDQIPPHHLRDLPRIIRPLRWHSDQRQPRRLEHVVLQRIALLPVLALVAGVIQFDACAGFQCAGVAQQEIHMLL